MYMYRERETERDRKKRVSERSFLFMASLSLEQVFTFKIISNLLYPKCAKFGR